VTGGELAPEVSDQVLGRAVMVGKVPGGKTGIVISEHLFDCPGGFNVAMGARDLPHPVQNATDPKIGGKLITARLGWFHLSSPGRPMGTRFFDFHTERVGETVPQSADLPELAGIQPELTPGFAVSANFDHDPIKATLKFASHPARRRKTAKARKIEHIR